MNTIFEVAKAAGLRTAWSEKHFGAYQIVQGPSGHGVDDLYSPEINSDPKNSLNPAVDPKITDFTKSHVEVKRYDAIKKDAIVNECFGLDSTGIHHAGTPAIFGMNFQTVSVAQKLAAAVDSSLKGGYLDADASPSTAIDSALEFVDASIGEMVSALRQCRLLAATTIIVTAKHGQSPIDPRKRRVVDDGKLADAVNSVEANLAAHVTADDVALIWLSDPSKTADAAEALRASDDLNSLPAETDPNDPTITWPARQGIQEVLWGEALKLRFADPAADSRTPDIIVFPTPGIIYSSAKSKKLAEHGGSTHDDVNVALLISTPAFPRRVIKTPVQTMQVAPTILKFLGLNPRKLDAVRLQQTDELPGFDSEEGEK